MIGSEFEARSERPMLLTTIQDGKLLIFLQRAIFSHLSQSNFSLKMISFLIITVIFFFDHPLIHDPFNKLLLIAS